MQARSGGRPAFPDIKGGHSNDLGTNFYALGTLGLLLRFLRFLTFELGQKSQPGQAKSTAERALLPIPAKAGAGHRLNMGWMIQLEHQRI